jgi:hypothetical protein
MGKLKFCIVKRIASWNISDSDTLELNIIKWGNNPEKYDLRKWSDGEPGKGVTIPEEMMDDLFRSIGEELGYEIDPIPNDDESIDASDEEDTISENLESLNHLFDIEPPFSFDSSVSDTEPSSVKEEIDFHDIFVYGLSRGCENYDHQDKELVRATVPILKRIGGVKTIEFNAVYCKDCGVYYITESEFDRISESGRILCQLMSGKEYIEYKRNLKDSDYPNTMQIESTLHMFGYNVGQKDDYSDSYRQKILDSAISSGVVTRSDAIGLIKSLIHRNERKRNFEYAVEKWRKDLAYLNNIDPVVYQQSRRLIGVKRIIKMI